MAAAPQPVLPAQTIAAPPENATRTETVELSIGGMACGACAARVEKALRAQDGVVDAGVNFATSRARVLIGFGRDERRSQHR